MNAKYLTILTIGVIAILLFAAKPTDATSILTDQDYNPADSQKAIESAEQSLVTLSVQGIVPTEWTENPTPLRPSGREWSAMVYDSARGVVVLFGGRDGFLDDTWEWDGTTWNRLNPVNHPSARYGHVMAYDSMREVVVLFGGTSASGNMDDTWEWTGTNWLQRTPVNHPSSRVGHAIAYDSIRGVVVLFGGWDSLTNFNDTWEWNGTNWVQRSPSSNPPARREGAMAFDSIRGVVVLFGGCCYYDDTWEWNGTNWVQRGPASSPAARDGHAMVFDSARGVTVLFGGWAGGFGPRLDDTWEWNGTQWIQRAPSDKPSARFWHAMAYDSARGVVVLFGGNDTIYRSDTWEWDGMNWENLQDTPEARYCHAMAYDSARGVVVLFGGSGLDDTWEWNGTEWMKRSPVSHPSIRCRHAMAYDSARGVVVLFGGSGTDETWEWNGIDWVKRSPAHRPAVREGHSMAYDSARGVVVLFGGSSASEFLGDTWEWNGTDWVQRSPVNHPTARYVFAMAYDSAREVVVLYGGWDGWYSDETWEWDGVNWIIRNPVTRPVATVRLSMVYDSARGVAVLFGGNDYDYRYDDTWEWDGTNWILRSLTSNPAPRNEHAMAYDSNRDVVVLFGGTTDNDELLYDTWLYAPLVPRPVLSPIENIDGDGEYLIEWSTVSMATSYTLEEDDSALFLSPTVRYQGDQTEFQVSLQGSGDWFYRVKATNSQGDSPWSNLEFTSVRPEAPTLYTIANVDGDGTYLVDWSDAIGSAAYELQEDDNSAFTSPTLRYTGANSQYQISGQQGGTWYYRVRASNAGGNSPWSNTQSVGVIPAAPVLLSISNPDGGGNYLVDWNDVTGALSYRLEEDDNSAFSSPVTRYEGDTSQYSITGQHPGLWYYRVRASNTTGGGAWSNIQSASVIPEAPILVEINNSDNNGDYMVDWNDVDGSTSYLLEEDDNTAFTSPTVRYNGINSQYQVSAQPTGLWYYRVRASCAGGDSPWSNIESISVAPTAPVLFPTNNPDRNGDYLVDWSDVTGATSYRLEQADDPAFTSPIVRYTGTNSQFQVIGQEIGTWYYRVIAINAYGESTWSSIQAVIVGWINYIPLVSCNR